jgi:hypothetical protein
MSRNVGSSRCKIGITLLGAVLSACLAVPAFAQSQCQINCQNQDDACVSTASSNYNDCMGTANTSYTNCTDNAEASQQSCQEENQTAWQNCFNTCMAHGGGSSSGCSSACDGEIYQQCTAEYNQELAGCQEALTNSSNACSQAESGALTGCQQALTSCQQGCQ